MINIRGYTFSEHPDVLENWPKWAQVLKSIKSNEHQSEKLWAEFSSKKSPSMAIFWLNSNIRYTKESIDSGMFIDVWQTPATTLMLGKGDCEDIACLGLAWAEYHKFPIIGVFIVRMITTGELHAIGIFKDNMRGFQVIDCRQALPISVNLIERIYEPKFLLGIEKWWRYQKA